MGTGDTLHIGDGQTAQDQTTLFAASHSDGSFGKGTSQYAYILWLQDNTLSPIVSGLKGIVREGYGVDGEGAIGVVGTGNWLPEASDLPPAPNLTSLLSEYTNTGVLGQSTAADGVVGLSAQANGVLGYSQSSSGVVGQSDNGEAYGVYGKCNGIGSGVGGENSDATGGSGVFGKGYVGVRAGGTAIGVFAQSDFGYGVSAYGGIGVYASCPPSPPVTSGFGLGNFAAWFDGATAVNGNFIVFGSKSAAVAFPDQSHRLLYCMESPECWFEDFGEAKLVRGRVQVKLPRDFATVIKTGSYHVFLTPYGNSNGLYVSKQDGKGFIVEEQGQGKSNVKFSYRIVGKRKDVKAERFAKVSKPTFPKPPKWPPPPKVKAQKKKEKTASKKTG